MSFFTRISNGWKMAVISFDTIQKNPSLMLFPVFSVISFVLVFATFAGGSFLLFGDQIRAMLDDEQYGRAAAIGFMFLYYLVNFFIIVYFNSALIYCTAKILNGEETNPSEGLAFANSRINKILGWSVLSATVGTLLQLLQETGKIGQIVSSLIGIAWSILTFFAVPVLIFEDKSVIDTVKESGRLMKQKWGESLAANMSFGLFHLLGVLVAIAVGILLSGISVILGIIVGIFIVLLVSTFISTAQTVFVAAMYNHVTGMPTGEFDDRTLDGMFIQKK
ncbi:MAG: hypothetical protein IPL27_19150 [Lewinellaceae bacterium]|nr:hypothetical protein [Lewinellaceae bacterium]